MKFKIEVEMEPDEILELQQKMLDAVVEEVKNRFVPEPLPSLSPKDVQDHLNSYWKMVNLNLGWKPISDKKS